MLKRGHGATYAPGWKGSVRIRTEQCATCIYRPDSGLADRLGALEDECRDPNAHYHFMRPRACHSESWPVADTICAGFAQRHGEDCTAVQVIRRIEAMQAAETSSLKGREAMRRLMLLSALFVIALPALMPADAEAQVVSAQQAARIKARCEAAYPIVEIDSEAFLDKRWREAALQMHQNEYNTLKRIECERRLKDELRAQREHEEASNAQMRRYESSAARIRAQNAAKVRQYNEAVRAAAERNNARVTNFRRQQTEAQQSYAARAAANRAEANAYAARRAAERERERAAKLRQIEEMNRPVVTPAAAAAAAAMGDSTAVGVLALAEAVSSGGPMNSAAVTSALTNIFGGSSASTPTYRAPRPTPRPAPAYTGPSPAALQAQRDAARRAQRAAERAASQRREWNTLRERANNLTSARAETSYSDTAALRAVADYARKRLRVAELRAKAARLLTAFDDPGVKLTATAVATATLGAGAVIASSPVITVAATGLAVATGLTAIRSVSESALADLHRMVDEW